MKATVEYLPRVLMADGVHQRLTVFGVDPVPYCFWWKGEPQTIPAGVALKMSKELRGLTPEGFADLMDRNDLGWISAAATMAMLNPPSSPPSQPAIAEMLRQQQAAMQKDAIEKLKSDLYGDAQQEQQKQASRMAELAKLYSQQQQQRKARVTFNEPTQEFERTFYK